MMACRLDLDSVRRTAALTALVVATTGACSSGPDLGLSPAGETGRAIAADSGCDSCHGDVGQGGVGPAWAGLFDSTILLDSGKEVTADAEYLRRSIVDPGVDQVDGYTVLMPPNSLTDSEIDAVITYIRELG